MKEFKSFGSSLGSLRGKLSNLDNLPDEDPDAQCPICDGYGHIIDDEGRAKHVVV
jgi:hypothetical protein